MQEHFDSLIDMELSEEILEYYKKKLDEKAEFQEELNDLLENAYLYLKVDPDTVSQHSDKGVINDELWVKKWSKFNQGILLSFDF